MINRNTAFVSAFVLSAVLGALSWESRRAASTTEPDPRDTSSNLRTAEPAESSIGSAQVSAQGSEGAPGPAIAAETPLRLVYDVRLDESIRFGGGAGGEAAATARDLSLSIAAKCELATIERTHGEVRQFGRCKDVEVRPAGQAGAAVSPAAAQGLATAIGQPFTIRRDESGRVTKIGLAARLDPLASGALRYFAGALQISRPLSAGARAWSAAETDASGAYRAEYTVRPGGCVLKRKLDYHRAGADGRRSIGEHEPRLSGEARAELCERAGGTIVSVEEHAEIGAAIGRALAAETRVTFKAHLIEADLAGPTLAAGSEASALVERPLDEVVSDPEVSRARDQRLLGGASLPALLDQHDRLPSGDERGFERAKIEQRLRALFRLDPAQSRAAAESVVQGVSSDAAGTLFSALGSAGHAEAQRALARIATAEQVDLHIREQAIAELGLVDHPLRAAVDALTEGLRAPEPSIAQAAAFGLGSAAASARTAGDPLADEAFRRLEAQLTGARDESGLRSALLALGNSGDPRIVALVQAHLANGAPMIRAAAAEALRHVSGDAADSILSAVLAGEDSAAQRGALAALRDRPLAPVLPALLALLGRAPSAAIRLEAISLIGARAGDIPGVGAILAQSAARDPDDNVRALAAELAQRVSALARR